MRTKSLMPWAPVLAALIFLLAAGEARAQQAVTPGRSVGRVFLGMAHGDVRKLLQKPWRSRVIPSSRLPAPHQAGHYTADEWKIGARFLTVLYCNAKVVQVELDSGQFVTLDSDPPAAPGDVSPAAPADVPPAAPGGVPVAVPANVPPAAPGDVSVTTPFAALRQRFPRIRVDLYLLMGGVGVDDEGFGTVTYYADDVRRGIAFTTANLEDDEAYEQLPHLLPDSVIVHLPGQRVLPTCLTSGVRITVAPSRREGHLPDIRTWFAGGSF